MTATELQRKVKVALDNLSVPVSKDYSEFEDVYPHIVYHELSSVPLLRGDDCEILFRVTYQVTIVTDDDNYEALESAVESAMSELGFVRFDTQDNFDTKFNRVLKFKIAALK